MRPNLAWTQKCSAWTRLGQCLDSAWTALGQRLDSAGVGSGGCTFIACTTLGGVNISTFGAWQKKDCCLGIHVQEKNSYL